MLTESLRRIGVLVRHNVLVRLRDPGQMISYIVLPIILMTVFKPLYEKAVQGANYQIISGPLVMFSIFTLAIVGNSILIEREWRTWDQLRVSRAHRAELLLGKTLPIMAILITQQLVVVLFGCALTGIPLPDTIGYVVPAILIWGVMLLAIGAALATIVRSRGEMGMVSDLGTMMVSAFGGALLPVSLMPSWARHVAPFSPGYWGVDMFQAALRGQPAHLVRPALVCLAIALVAGTFATYRLAHGFGRGRLM
ncbi:ABC transporter permease [Sphaerisporangium album]|uniref:Transport permease protein n=1 Tax=Sphaerisporangium album TaxID=509200 RepID=A0A367F976_9ACTN|nr:ABC transporter permease [Sphaerisporangium album]RCG26489.1 ABC transporter permease [Sphaerisporangium album]